MKLSVKFELHWTNQIAIIMAFWDVCIIEYRMFWMWNICFVGYSGCEMHAMFGMWNV